MGREIERKFLVRGEGWRGQGRGTLYRQGYLASGKGPTVRVRIAGDKGFLTIKGPAQGLTRAEYEYEIPLADAREMLENLCDGRVVEKVRHRIPGGPGRDVVWEVDEFQGRNHGLLLAEVELEREEQPFDRPDWLGEEVTDDPRYRNAYLARHPYTTWSS